MARGTDNNQLKLAAKTQWRWQQQFVDDNKDDDDDDNDEHNFRNISTKLVTPMKTETGIHTENMLPLKPDM